MAAKKKIKFTEGRIENLADLSKEERKARALKWDVAGVQNPEGWAALWRESPVTTKEGKYALIVGLCNSMRDSFLAKLDKIPEDWDGIELKTWMSEAWEREGFRDKLKRNTKRGRKYHSDLYHGNL